VNSQNAINVALYEKVSFDFVRDIAPVGRVESVPLVIARATRVPGDPEYQRFFYDLAVEWLALAADADCKEGHQTPTAS
jgi:hypothetical protein